MVFEYPVSVVYPLLLLSLSWSLSSSVKKVPKFIDEDEAEVVSKLFIQNMEAKLSCPTNLNQISIKWFKDDEPFVKRPLGRIIQKEHWIKLPGLLVAFDKANYTCVVNTEFGILQRTFIVDIIIQHRGPAEFTAVPENRTVFEGEDAELICRFISGDAAYVQWVKHYTVNDSYMSSSGIFYVQTIQTGLGVDSDPGRLTIRNCSESDSGWYTCVVSNRFGSVHRGAWLQVNRVPTSQTPLPPPPSPSYNAKTLVGTAVGVIVALVVMSTVAMVTVWKRGRRRLAVISLIKSPIYRPINLAVPHDPEWEILQEHLQIGDLVGEGAFGRVHVGHVTRTDVLSDPLVVAVKMLKEGATHVEIQDLIWELKTLKSVGHHVNVINFIGYCVPNEGSLMVVVEFAPYGNLREYLWKCGPLEPSKSSDDYLRAADLNERPLTTRDLVLFAYQVARGMEYLASRKIVHRDLAARNVLVAEDRVLKIADFGLTRDMKEKDYYRRTSNGRVPVKWMALESLTDSCCTTKTDVWSYGVLLWEIFTFGSNPYPSIPVESLLHVLQQGHRMERPHYASSEIYSIMLRCWQRLPADRPDFLELVELFDQLVAQSTDFNYLTLETAFDDSVFHESLEEVNDPLNNGYKKVVATVHSQPHGSDSLYASMSSKHTLSRSNSGTLCDSDREEEFRSSKV